MSWVSVLGLKVLELACGQKAEPVEKESGRFWRMPEKVETS